MNKMVYDGFHKVEVFDAVIKGKSRKFEKLGIRSAVAAYVRDAEGKVCLVEQYRPCVGKVLLELPAGLKDNEGMTPEQILIGELEEECGIKKADIISIGDGIPDYYIMCGSSDATMRIYSVELSTIEKSHEVDDIDVDRVVWVTTDELKELYYNGQLSDTKTLMMFFLHMKNIGQQLEI